MIYSKYYVRVEYINGAMKFFKISPVWKALNDVEKYVENIFSFFSKVNSGRK